MATLKVKDLGGYIRDQRSLAKVSLRQLAEAAGVSNPYLSQIERGLRKPSAEILQQIAKALRISAEALYVQAGILEDRGEGTELAAAILAAADLNERQKQVLLEVYESFRRENASRRDAEDATAAATVPEAGTDAPAATPSPSDEAGAEPASPPRRRGTRTTRSPRTTSARSAAAPAPEPAPHGDPLEPVSDSDR